MFQLPALPYAIDALAPHVSSKTLMLHHGKHHKGYVDKLNSMVLEHDHAGLGLTDVIGLSSKDPAMQVVFNNAAQCWNHEFLWNSMAPNGGGVPTGRIATLIDAHFGKFDTFGEAFVAAAVGHFGSGWIWLVFADQELKIVTTHDADLPLVHGQVPLLTCDLWEHAYYVDYENRRVDYIHAFLAHLANWHFANANLADCDLSS